MKTRFQSTAAASKTLADLVGSVRAVTRGQVNWARAAALVAGELRAHLPAPEILTAEQRYGDPHGYRSYLLHAEYDGSFSVVALVWRPGQATPVHDHVTWCASGVIQGAEQEQQYRLTGDGWLEECGSAVNRVGDVSALAPPGDIHLVRNAGDQVAISVHVYGTDVSRLASSVRRVYDLPVVIGAGG
jgi:3-mercaptopropionate dioxygenase